MSARGECVSCGTPLAGSYCHACGERDARERPASVTAFLREALRDATDLNGRTPRSLLLLFREPGRLTREYLAGRRRPFLHPLQVFLLANLLFFVAVPLTGITGLSSPLRAQLYDQVYSDWTRTAVRERNLQADSADFRTFEARFDQAARVQSRSLVILLVPLFAFALFLTRAWRREGALHHLVFAVHYIAVVLVVLLALGLLAALAARVPALARALPPAEWPLGIATLALLAGYLFVALRNAYGDSRAAAAVRALALAAATLASILLYRFLLFYTVLISV